MRRANQPSQNGQYRVAIDHLGSSTLIIDTSSPPQVVSRQYHKPYGELAWQGGGTPIQQMTTIGYTGQRLDQDSGLMFYNARFYDPFLSHFVSADTIGVDKGDPKTRNRYSYVVNNPLRFVDPTGHCYQEDKDIQECRDKLRELEDHGIIVDIPLDWSIEEIRELLYGIQQMMRAFGWNIRQFRYAMGTDYRGGYIYLLRVSGSGAGGWYCDGGPFGGCANNDNRRQIALNGGRAAWEGTAKSMAVTFVHELAHAWDGATIGAMSNVMAAETGSYVRDGYYYAGGHAASEYGGSGSVDPGRHGPQEDWAEAVAAYVFPNHSEFVPRGGAVGEHAEHRRPGMDEKRRNYVRQRGELMKRLCYDCQNGR